LPVALKTSLAFVEAKKDPSEIYEGSFQTTGECTEPCLYRLFADYETLSADPRFEELAHKVYGPLQQWVLSHVTATAHTQETNAGKGTAP
jgi:exodeoxyribonuclease V gamma subunit